MIEIDNVTLFIHRKPIPIPEESDFKKDEPSYRATCKVFYIQICFPGEISRGVHRIRSAFSDYLFASKPKLFIKEQPWCKLLSVGRTVSLMCSGSFTEVHPINSRRECSP